jgi:hypothetical protein
VGVLLKLSHEIDHRYPALVHLTGDVLANCTRTDLPDATAVADLIALPNCGSYAECALPVYWGSVDVPVQGIWKMNARDAMARYVAKSR